MLNEPIFVHGDAKSEVDEPHENKEFMDVRRDVIKALSGDEFKSLLKDMLAEVLNEK